ncbi:MAG: sigma-54-dependent Fis family transcriptional regulator [Gammaproteobacteria bacterium]|nr:MAG: sigma-54-dependent Fis family transcriptional regulator [Gammaproteobacteria bacterium]
MKKKKTILIVDDEYDIRSLLTEILTNEGYFILSAENATQANEHLKKNRPSVVLLDVWMPGQDGISLLKKWQKTKPYDTKVIMMSGHATIENAMEATKYGAVDFVEKPISLPLLLKTIKKYLKPKEIEKKAYKNKRKIEELFKLKYKEAIAKFDKLYLKNRIKKQKNISKLSMEIGLDRTSIYRKIKD